MSHTPYAILIDVPEPKPICFIAAPFGLEFDAVSNAIEKAASDWDLQPIRTDREQKGKDFVERIFIHIRSARIIVAVCSPEAESRKPNVNVMYELGLANSIGKPTLMITSDASTLPADIRNMTALQYDRGEMEQEGKLVPKISAEIGRILRDCEIADFVVGGISVVLPGQRMLFSSAFWPSYETILSFANQIHEECQTTKHQYLGHLVRRAEDIVCRPSKGKHLDQDIQALHEILNLYISRIQDLVTPIALERLSETFRHVERSLTALEALANTEAHRKRISDIRSIYESVKKGLDSYSAAYRIGQAAKTTLLGGSRGKNRYVQVWTQLRDLDDAARDLTTNVDHLIADLIAMITREEEDRLVKRARA